MAQDAQTWVSPYKSGIVLVDKIFHSLTEWLMNSALFQNGVTIGNGTPPTYSSTSGAQTAPAPAGLLEFANSGVGLQIAGSPIPLVQSGSTVVTTNGSGVATITYPAFPTGVTTVVACSGGFGGAEAMVAVATPLSNGSFTVEVWNSAGTLMTSLAVRINWVATGT